MKPCLFLDLSAYNFKSIYTTLLNLEHHGCSSVDIFNMSYFLPIHLFLFVNNSFKWNLISVLLSEYNKRDRSVSLSTYNHRDRQNECQTAHCWKRHLWNDSHPYCGGMFTCLPWYDLLTVEYYTLEKGTLILSDLWKET